MQYVRAPLASRKLPVGCSASPRINTHVVVRPQYGRKWHEGRIVEVFGCQVKVCFPFLRHTDFLAIVAHVVVIYFGQYVRASLVLEIWAVEPPLASTHLFVVVHPEFRHTWYILVGWIVEVRFLPFKRQKRVS